MLSTVTAVRLFSGLEIDPKSQLTCYSKAPFVKFYTVIHQMCYNLHGSAFGLGLYCSREREREARKSGH